MTNATAISRSRVWSVLTTPAAIPQTGPRLKTNLDTDLLKLIAIAAMLIDHIGGAFFPEVGVFRWIGRLAFPIFCYCLTASSPSSASPFTSWPSTRSANSGPTSPTGTSSSPCS